MESVSKMTVCDTIFAVEYSDSSSFNKILLSNTFFQKSKNGYSLQSNDLDIDFWTGGNISMERPNVDQYYVRIIGICDDIIFYTSEVKHWYIRRCFEIGENRKSFINEN